MWSTTSYSLIICTHEHQHPCAPSRIIFVFERGREGKTKYHVKFFIEPSLVDQKSQTRVVNNRALSLVTPFPRALLRNNLLKSSPLLRRDFFQLTRCTLQGIPSPPPPMMIAAIGNTISVFYSESENPKFD